VRGEPFFLQKEKRFPPRKAQKLALARKTVLVLLAFRPVFGEYHGSGLVQSLFCETKIVCVSTTIIVILAFGVLCTAVFLYTRIKFAGVYGLITKVLASLCFVALALYASYQTKETYAFLILGGLILGLIGDAFLDLRQIYQNERAIYTSAGMIAFSLGHLPFIGAIYNDAQLSPTHLLMAAGAAAIFATTAMFLEKPLNLVYGKFKVISSLYAWILSMMTACALIAAFMQNFESTRYNVLAIAGILFIASDLILSGIYFDREGRKNTPKAVFYNHLTYYGAQFLIAMSICL